MKRDLDHLSKPVLSEKLSQCFRQHPILSSLACDKALDINLNQKIRTYANGDFIFHEGDEASYCWLVIQGEVKLIRHTTKGQLLLIDIIFPGEMFGMIFYMENPIYPASAVSMRKTHLFGIPLRILIEELRGNPELKGVVLEDTCRRLCQSIALRGLALEEVSIRIGTLILRFLEKFGTQIPITRTTLAELAGTTTETSIRVTRSMEKKGILKLRRGLITVTDLKGLQKVAGNTILHIHTKS